MRRYIIGPGGATLKKVVKEYPGVRVSVPPPRDPADRTVIVRGPRRQVAAAVAFLETELEKEEQTESCITVAPHLRRHIIGPGGATIRRMEQQFRGVRLTMPPLHDRASHNVWLEGPRSQVPGAVCFIKSVLQEAEAAQVKPRTRTTRRQAGRRRAVAQ